VKRNARAGEPRRLRLVALVIFVATCLGTDLAEAQIGPSTTTESRALSRAASAERAGQIETAREELETILDANPGSSSALAMLAQLLTPRGRAAEVLPHAERAVAANGPDDMVAMVVWIRTLGVMEYSDSALASAERWVEERPGKPTAYGEWSRLLTAAGKSEEAAEVLVAGREATGNPSAFAQELSALRASAGDYEGAAEEWATLLGWGDSGVSAVVDRFESSEVDSEAAVRALKEVIADGEYPVHVRRGALSLALQLDDRQWSREIVEQIVESVPAETRRLVLREFYVEAHNRSWSVDASWAANRLEEDSDSAAERRHWRAMRADVDYLSGNSAEAEQTFSALARSASPGTETHRRSVRRLFSIRAAEGSPEAETLLVSYAAEYPEDTTESVEMAVELSIARMTAGDIAGANAALDLLPPPGDPSLSSRIEGQRGVLDLLAGRPALALSHLETAAFIPGGDPVRRTDALQLAAALDRADSVSATALGRGMFSLLAARDPGPILTAAESWASDGAPEAAPTLLALAAAALERAAFPSEARQVRQDLVSTYPASAEAPGAMLALGREALPRDSSEARVWFERLVLEHREHALAPVARQELAIMDQMQ
jgi:tetratricopeptide (TPR) repeat protein